MVFAILSYPAIDPTLLQIGPLRIRWYGMAYLLGFAIAYAALRQMSRKGVLRLPTAAVGDLVSWLAAGVVLGGRAGWWLFYHRADGSIEPWYEPFAIWHGGMSFHGGLIGVVTVLWIWSRKQSVSLWNLTDCLARVAPTGLFFGRIANFINAELVGRTTSVPWGMIFPGDSVPRHPSQLYEAVLEGPCLYLLLRLASRTPTRRDGFISAWFLILYGTFRFLVEFTRQPDSQLGFIAFGWLTMGQLLSIGLAVAGMLLWLRMVRQYALIDPATATATTA